jgi:hypothetical protein
MILKCAVETVDFTDATDDQSNNNIHDFTSQVKAVQDLSFLRIDIRTTCVIRGYMVLQKLDDLNSFSGRAGTKNC